MTRCAVLALCGLFLLAGLTFVPLLGIQNDEALFGFAAFPPRAGVYIPHLGSLELPLMVMSYIGALKAWLYRPVFAVFGTNVWAVRVPMLLAGTASIWLFYFFLRRIAGERAALIGCGLLAADASYLLTICFDWGPVALQHLLLIGGLYLVVRSWQDKQEAALAAGFFLFGLAMWDKAAAIWSLNGFAVAGIVAAPRELLRFCTVRRLLTAGLAFTFGALPLIAYNVASGGTTIRDTVSTETSGIAQKVRVLRGTADGSLLFGWLLNGDAAAPRPSEPCTKLQRISAAVATATRNPKSNFLLYAFGVALLLAPLGTGDNRRAVLFALVAMAAIWAQIAATANAGGGAHHAILLWPFPQMLIGISWAAAPRRLGRWGKPAVAAALAIVMAAGLAVINEYRVLMVRNGGAVNWNDAIYALSNDMKTMPARAVYCVDWGLMGSLHLLNRGRLPVLVGWEELAKATWTAVDRAHLSAMVTQSGGVFLTHTPELEMFRGFNDRLIDFAKELGYRRDMLAVIADRHRRPTFEVYRFVRAQGEGAN